jgi:hypothetical protein
MMTVKLSGTQLIRSHPHKQTYLSGGQFNICFLVLGWGAMDPDSPKRPKELQVVDVNMVDSRKCERWHRKNNIEVKCTKIAAFEKF